MGGGCGRCCKRSRSREVEKSRGELQQRCSLSTSRLLDLSTSSLKYFITPPILTDGTHAPTIQISRGRSMQHRRLTGAGRGLLVRIALTAAIVSAAPSLAAAQDKVYGVEELTTKPKVASMT